MTLIDSGYLLSLVFIGVAGLLVILAIDFLGKRNKHAQDLGESEGEKKEPKDNDPHEDF